MEKKHTPLPWVKDFGGSIGHIKSIAENNKKRTPTVCRYDQCAISVSSDEADANAELIVTAVNSYYPMLEALKNAETLLEFAINATPTGAVRNLLTEANIRTKAALALTENNSRDTITDGLSIKTGGNEELITFIREIVENSIHIGGTDYRINEKYIEKANQFLVRYNAQ